MKKEILYVMLGFTLILFLATHMYATYKEQLREDQLFEDQKLTNELQREKERQEIEIAKMLAEEKRKALVEEQKSAIQSQNIESDLLEMKRYEKGFFTKFGIKPGYDGEGNCIDEKKCNS